MMEHWLAVNDDLMINLDQLTLVRFGAEADGTPYCLLWFAYAVEHEDDGRMMRDHLGIKGADAEALHHYMLRHATSTHTAD